MAGKVKESRARKGKEERQAMEGGFTDNQEFFYWPGKEENEEGKKKEKF